MMHRDWTKTLAPASYRGVGFKIEKEQISESGRDVAVHTFVKSEDHATEDMRRKVRKYKVTAYIASDVADVEAAALVTACSTKGAATLVLPISGAVQVRCTGCSTSHAKDKLGYVAFDLEFIEAGNDSAFPAIALGDRIAAGIAGTMSAVVGAALSAFSQ